MAIICWPLPWPSFPLAELEFYFAFNPSLAWSETSTVQPFRPPIQRPARQPIPSVAQALEQAPLDRAIRLAPRFPDLLQSAEGRKRLQ